MLTIINAVLWFDWLHFLLREVCGGFIVVGLVLHLGGYWIERRPNVHGSLYKAALSISMLGLLLWATALTCAFLRAMAWLCGVTVDAS